MRDNFLNRKRNRLPEFDYSQTGYYFVTICTDSMAHFFGSISNGEMILNEYGKIADEKLNELPKRYVYAEIDEYTIMPNHVHVILIIDRSNVINAERHTVGTTRELSQDVLSSHEQPITNNNMINNGTSQGTSRDLSLQPQTQTKIKSLSELIGVFKTTSSKAIHQTGLIDFKWQRSFLRSRNQKRKRII